MKNVAVLGCTLVCEPDGTAVIGTPPSSYNFSENKGIYSGPLSITVTGSSTGGAAKNATGSGVLQPTSKYCQADGKFVVLEGDSITITATGTTADSPPKTVSGPVKVTIIFAGQSTVQGE